ncbi:uncharacterized protein [Ambystoma mexicanum]|uniref:uncharacterized protein n=1 Tax=Ambystoma mexicanum TaxID=8296 RepID=UPI0037E77E90
MAARLGWFHNVEEWTVVFFFFTSNPGAAMQSLFRPLCVLILLTGAVWNLTEDLTEEHQLLLKNLTGHMKDFSKHSEDLKSMNRTHINLLVWSVQEVLDTLKDYQREAYKAVHPQTCPLPEAPSNGGVVCTSMDNVHYCKPMCNQGYDFSFLRRTRLYEECGNHTGNTWTTQFIGGKRLANCIASKIAVSGAPSAYFPADMKCQKTIVDSTIEDQQIHIFLTELRAKNITQNHDMKTDCIICGD